MLPVHPFSNPCHACIRPKSSRRENEPFPNEVQEAHRQPKIVHEVTAQGIVAHVVHYDMRGSFTYDNGHGIVVWPPPVAPSLSDFDEESINQDDPV